MIIYIKEIILTDLPHCQLVQTNEETGFVPHPYLLVPPSLHLRLESSRLFLLGILIFLTASWPRLSKKLGFCLNHLLYFLLHLIWDFLHRSYLKNEVNLMKQHYTHLSKTAEEKIILLCCQLVMITCISTMWAAECGNMYLIWN